IVMAPSVPDPVPPPNSGVRLSEDPESTAVESSSSPAGARQKGATQKSPGHVPIEQPIRQNTVFWSSHPWAASGILALASLVASVASAQDGQQTGGAEVTTGGAQSPVVSASPYYNPNVDLEKINSYLPSSSRPIVDGREQDGFDLNR